MTTHPFFNHSPLTNSALPMAATTISASFNYESMRKAETKRNKTKK